jgi:hypothetical protein
MRRRISVVGLFALGAAIAALSSAPRTAHAQGKPKTHAGAPRKPPKKSQKKPEPEAETPDTDAASDTAASDDKAADKPDKGEPTAVKAAGTNATKAAPGAAAPVVVKEDKAGVKTYKFGTVEVEGRMKSPQIIYFLRRVRAEFDAGLLGHRSFMRELSDTRNNPSFR